MYVLAPLIRVTTAMMLATLMVTPSTVSTVRSLFCHRDCIASLIASWNSIALGILYAVQSPSVPRAPPSSAVHSRGRRLDDRRLPRPVEPGQRVGRGRKVRTPQGSVPDNVRDLRFKAQIRPVQQKIYRPRTDGVAQVKPGKPPGVRVKR